jgi:peptide/nickel transport system ATP-binding protein/oligopeptide transport system ATP-binding protein
MKRETLQNQEILVDIKNLILNFNTNRGQITALDGIDLKLYKNESLGLVGETGCGKSITALSIMRLIPAPPGKIVQGEIFFDGKDLLKIPETEIRRIRGGKISMIFQEPSTSLNPVFKVGDQIIEAIQLHQKLGREKGKRKTVEMLEKVGMPDPKDIINRFPHELSGGMQQRIMIAIALSSNPKLLIADEPTTALDVTTQAQILDLIKDLKKDIISSMLLITHDLGIVAEICDRVAVMYTGNIIEHAELKTLFKSPLHPYTRGLLDAIPKMNAHKKELGFIPGTLPDLMKLPEGVNLIQDAPIRWRSVLKRDLG